MNKSQNTHNSYSFKEFFLIEFTRELIRHSGEGEVSKLKNILVEKAKEKKEAEKALKPKKILEKVIDKKKYGEIRLIREEKIKIPRRVMRPAVLRIPEIHLPPQFRYLRPYPTSLEIDLGKLNPLLKDPFVKIIECNGPFDHIVVQGSMGRKKTDILLSQDEIMGVIKGFSKASKIPIHTGIYKVVLGSLILLAIVSEVINSKFIIKKMALTMYPTGSQILKSAQQPRQNLRMISAVPMPPKPLNFSAPPSPPGSLKH